MRADARVWKQRANNPKEHGMNADYSRIALLSWAIALLNVTTPARADVVTDCNTRAATIATAAGLPPPSTYRVMAVVQVAVYEAVNSISRKYPPFRLMIDAQRDASIDAATAAANRASLIKLVPNQQTAIEAAYQIAITGIADGAAKSDGIAVGEQAAASVLDYCAGDGANAPEMYRPFATAGVYVPTSIPIASQWGRRRPWSMARGDQFRPGPPPELKSDVWANDYNEVKAIGARNSAQRTPEQTAIAIFWQATTPAIYFPVARSVALGQPDRDVTKNARLLAAVAAAMDDAFIAVFDAKYAYNFWRPVTAIRNGDIDGNDATERDAAWIPMIDTPLHPEYPCAHCIIAASVGAVLSAEVGSALMPRLTSTSPTAPGAPRSWESTDALVTEVSLARIYGGVHYRNSAEVGRAMGKLIGEQIAKNFLVVVR
jgi:hypothetical protein